ncbi:hypothetical protein P3X46_013588 [Hevea brasiliensis]|uniref:Protein kinase domain-containing protein n=1 Tax=Hevea brasiliensis TaxID=3981 RepID=A0ABQ9M469_HEVBR|nr:hypothetical protein P3X46_013588 [Hevea brasiliensis]
MESSKHLSFCTFIIRFLFTFFPFKVQSSTETTAFSFNEFSPNNMTEIRLEGDAYAEDLYIKLTKSFDQLSSDGSVGRATYYKPIHLWDKSGNIADFKTYFSFSINSNGNESRGNGFAFFLANNGSKLEPSSGSGRLGLLSSTNAQPPFVAVEFGTGTSKWDLADGNDHIGIDLNSLSSVVVTGWTLNDIANGGEIQAWIEYNSSSKNLSVLVTNGYENYTGKHSYNLHHTVDFREYLTDEWVTVDFSAATTVNLFEEHEIHTWNFNSTLQVNENLGNLNQGVKPIAVIYRKRENKGWIWALLGISGTLILVLSILGFVWYGYCKKRRRQTENGPGTSNDDFEKKTGPRSFLYNELVLATNNFETERLLGKGGFGRVYIGILSDNSCVAVKRITTSESHQGLKAYVSEVKAISRLRHRNLVQLIGWCRNKQELFVIYEFMPNKSLDFHLFNKKCLNILLDSHFNAKLGDFRLAMFVEHGHGSGTARLIRIEGYGEIGGWIWEHYRRGNIFGAADPQLEQSYAREEMERLIMVGLACAHPNHSHRPSIREAFDILNARAPLPKLQLEMPMPENIASYHANMNASSGSSSLGAGVSEAFNSG